MKTKIPNFTYRSASSSNKYVACVEMDGTTIHRIENIDDFYKEFGYTTDIGKSGLLPDEFIWHEYTKNPSVNFAACMQMHFIRYLMKHSGSFMEKHGQQCKDWLAAYIEENAATGLTCVACRVNSICYGETT